jgi:hypothetical protein
MIRRASHSSSKLWTRQGPSRPLQPLAACPGAVFDVKGGANPEDFGATFNARLEISGLELGDKIRLESDVA